MTFKSSMHRIDSPRTSPHYRRLSHFSLPLRLPPEAYSEMQSSRPSRCLLMASSTALQRRRPARSPSSSVAAATRSPTACRLCARFWTVSGCSPRRVPLVSMSAYDPKRTLLFLLLLHGHRRHQVRNQDRRTSGIDVHCPYLCQRHHRHYSLDKFLFSCG